MLRELFDAFQTKIEASAGSNGLGITTVLGRPRVGRTEVTLPMAAVLFSHYGPAQAASRVLPRIGNTMPPGNTVKATLYIYASGEGDLLDLLDQLQLVKHAVASVVAGSSTFVIRYGETERLPYNDEDAALDFAVMTEVIFSAAN